MKLCLPSENDKKVINNLMKEYKILKNPEIFVFTGNTNTTSSPFEYVYYKDPNKVPFNEEDDD